MKTLVHRVYSEAAANGLVAALSGCYGKTFYAVNLNDAYWDGQTFEVFAGWKLKKSELTELNGFARGYCFALTEAEA